MDHVSEDQQDHTKEKTQAQEASKNKPDETQKHIEALEQKIKDFDDKAKRYLADYQNLQRRVQEEKYQWIRQSNKELLLKLLPVLDTLMLAHKHVKDKGLELAIDQFAKVLEGEGLNRIETKDKEFNPETMECITTQKVEGKTHKVIEELRSGYQLDKHVIRTAQVVVGE